MLSPGLRREDHRVVLPSDSAAAALAIVPDVLASARMIFFIETVCAELMLEHLAPGQMSVGIGFDLTHDAATPIGMKIYARVEVTEVRGRRVEFTVEARDEIEVIGKGKHVRAVIDIDRFNARLAEKRARMR